ncbi:MAG: hypothetical protein RLZZ383_30 [Pseudomonadota bacterium]|jgi:outer membrane biosynthesis protein TonB
MSVRSYEASWARRHRRSHRWVLFGVLATALVAGSMTVLEPLGLLPSFSGRSATKGPAHLVLLRAPSDALAPKPPTPAEEPPPPPPPDVSGQIVELPPPLLEERPDDARFLSEYDVRVEQETRTERTSVNPEVLAPTYSEASKYEREEAEDLHIDKPSTGARVGARSFVPGRDGNMAALPSPHARTNKDGPDDPVPASHAASALAGSPQNDWIDAKIGDQLAINAREYVYAGYLDRIRRMINEVWVACIDAVPESERLERPRYTTEADVLLDSVGALEAIEIGRPSGSDKLDACVVTAFRLAGPFPNPPDGLIGADGLVALPRFGFIVTVSQATMTFPGIDPNAGVMFPGILKSPR